MTAWPNAPVQWRVRQRRQLRAWLVARERLTHLRRDWPVWVLGAVFVAGVAYLLLWNEQPPPPAAWTPNPWAPTTTRLEALEHELRGESLVAAPESP